MSDIKIRNKYHSKLKINETNKIPWINLIPAVAIGVGLEQKFLPEAGLLADILILTAFTAVFMAFMLIPYISLIPILCSAFFWIGSAWILADHIDVDSIRILVKVISSGFFGLLEFSFVVNSVLKDKNI